MAVARNELSNAQARRIALQAQGFGSPRPGGRVDRRHVRKVFDRTGLIQIDSVNVLVRSQEMPLFARLGSHDRSLLARMTDDGELFEFWCHEASLLPVSMHPLLRWTMNDSARMWRSTAAAGEDRAYLESVYEEIRDRGPISAGELSEPGEKRPGMWGRSKGKKALEHLFWSGRVSGRRRRSDFARVYDLTERMIPAEILARPGLDEPDARRELLVLAAASLGVATERDLCDYHRLNLPKSRVALSELVEAGRLLPVTVEGWGRQAYLHPDAHLPRWIRGGALLSPFDSLVWERARVERLFGFRYRIEIYTRPEDRVHGYYVLPFLLDDRLVARVDLKADRAAATLLVQSAFAEPGGDRADVAAALAAELGLMAGWLGLESVTVVGRGDLAPALAAAVSSTKPVV